MSGMIKAGQLSDKVNKITTVSKLRSLGDYIGLFSDLFFVSDLNKNFKYDPSDTTSIDDGVDIIVNVATGKVYKSVLDARVEEEIGVAISDRLPYVSISALKASNKPFTNVYITDNWKTGVFKHDPSDTSSVGDDALVIVDAGGRRFKRQYDGEALATWWGVIPDGTTDQATLWNNALSSSAKILRFPYFPSAYRIYRVDIPSGKTIIFDKGVVVKGMGLDSSQELIRITDADNVIVSGYGATINGVRENYTVAEQFKGGIAIRSSKNIIIEGLRIESFNGDGVYLGTKDYGDLNENVIFRDLDMYNISRNGISVINAKGLDIENINVDKVDGFAPMAGIDLEPNNDKELLQNIRIRGLTTSNCEGAGLLFSFMELGGTNNDININVDGFTDRGSRWGIIMQIVDKPVNGSVIINGAVLKDNKLCSFLANSYCSRAPRVELNSPVVYNPHSSGVAHLNSFAAFLMFREVNETTSADLGNIHIYNPKIVETRTSSIPNYSDFMFRDRAEGGYYYFTNCTISNPYSLGAPDRGISIFAPSLREFPVLHDDRRLFYKDIGTWTALTICNTVVSGVTQQYFRYIDNKTSTGERDVILRSECIDKTIVTIEVQSNYYVNIKTTGNAPIRPLLNVGTQHLRSTKVGSKVTLQKDNITGSWVVIDIIGDWYDNYGSEVTKSGFSSVYYLSDTSLTLIEGDAIVYAQNTIATTNVYLPPVARSKGKRVTVKKTNANVPAYPLRIRGSNSELIETSNIFELIVKDEVVTVVSDGIIWKVEHRSGDDRVNHIVDTSYVIKPFLSTLNTTYGDKSIGFEVLAPNIATGSKIYKKMDNTTTGNWMEISATIITATT